MKRELRNPLITINDIIPSNDFLNVIGVFNCGATKYNDEIILLLRIAEEVINKDDGNIISIPIIKNGKMELKKINKKESNYDFSDSRVIRNESGSVINLTSISHFRKARSKDGINFIIDEKPWISASNIYDEWGIEDPRVTKLDNEYYITYTQASNLGVSVGLIKTNDFESYERMGTIFTVDNKDVSIFPEKIKGKYYSYHRPIPSDIGTPNIWLASSSDLLNWGNHKVVMSVDSNNFYENGRVGGGAPSIRVKEGWLHIFHSATKDNMYTLGAFLTSYEDPSVIIKKSKEPILIPKEDYEINGFFGNVVFTCGVIEQDNELLIYYGAADDKIALARVNTNELLNRLIEV